MDSATSWRRTIKHAPSLHLRTLGWLVIPLAVMTTYPAMALLGTLRATTALAALAGALTLSAVARLVWRFAVGHYTSASS